VNSWLTLSSRRGARRAAAASAQFVSFFVRLPRRCLAHISDWRRRGHDRQLLERLDDQALRDLGIDRSIIENESAVPIWRLH